MNKSTSRCLPGCCVVLKVLGDRKLVGWSLIEFLLVAVFFSTRHISTNGKLMGLGPGGLDIWDFLMKGIVA